MASINRGHGNKPAGDEAEVINFRDQRRPYIPAVGYDRRYVLASPPTPSNPAENPRDHAPGRYTSPLEELANLKIAVNQLADKLNARGVDTQDMLYDMHHQIDKAIYQGIHLGASLALAALSSQTGEDYSTRPVGFAGENHPHEVEGIGEQLERYHDHATTIAAFTNPKSVLNTLFP